MTILPTEIINTMMIRKGSFLGMLSVSSYEYDERLLFRCYGLMGEHLFRGVAETRARIALSMLRQWDDAPNTVLNTFCRCRYMHRPGHTSRNYLHCTNESHIRLLSTRVRDWQKNDCRRIIDLTYVVYPCDQAGCVMTLLRQALFFCC